MIYFTVAAIIAFLMPVGGDFVYFYQAAQALAHGASPYSVPGYFSPVHVAMLFVPLTAFDVDTAFRLHAVIALTVFMLALRRMAGPRLLVILLASPAIWLSANYGNVEYWPVLALFLPAPAAILAALVKPQVGFVLVVWLVWREWRARGLIAAAQAVAPAALIMAASLGMGMHLGSITGAIWNTSLWPVSIVPGVVLAVAAWLRRDKRLALAAGPCLSPYVNAMSWAALLPAGARSMRAAAAIVAFQWIVVLVLTNNLTR